MLIDRHALLRLQDAFDRATAAYKLQVGDRTAWSDFYDSVLHGLNSVKPSPTMAPHEYAEAVGVRALELRLEVLAEYPELLALTRQELNTARGYPLVQPIDSQLEVIRLQNHYNTIQVDHSPAAQEYRLRERDLEMCAELPPAHKLQHALDRMGIAYHSFCLESGGRRKADQSRAIWNGICMWFARRLGPIPSALLATDAFDGLLWVLENRHQPLDKSCAYFRLSMRWLVDDLKGPLVIYEKKVGKFYTALAAPSQAEHWWLLIFQNH
ncbi:hypothetical protein C6P46_002189 [Rhodotorula mucilaginosa]|uniref:Uncharacterized protein n=1 Tax=Rhodotorula mucilaginosa TaxID=5537 RepID=A0A9P6VSU1_RHOMI|nr:hypothetical protein C6P46_002189 [Rhodotorula mucilaginosa]